MPYSQNITLDLSELPDLQYITNSFSISLIKPYIPHNDEKFATRNGTNPAQLQVTDGKLNKSYNSDSNLELGNPNMKLNGKYMHTETIPESMQKILMSS